MSVGLYDCDLATLRSYPLNLDIMKLSAYYKLKKNEIVTLTDYFNPAPYSKYIIRKDYQDGVFPKRMANYDNIEYGGLGFTNGNYISLPEEMELMLPDYSIYTNILQKPAFKCQKKWVGVGKKVSHFRLSLDGKNIWDKFPSTMPHIGRNGVLFSHDYNITDIKDSYECICDLSMSTFGTLSNYLPNFGTKFPIIVDNFEDLTKWLKISLSRGTFLQYNGFLEDGQIIDLIDICNKKKHTSHSFTYCFQMPPCDSYEENKKYLMKLFFQILYLWKHSEKFSLINGAEFHRSNEWRGFFRLLSNMGRIGRDKLYKENYTFYEFALELFRHQPYGWLPSTIITESMDIIIREDARRVFEFVRYEFPELFCKFHTTYNLQYKGGEFVDVS